MKVIIVGDYCCLSPEDVKISTNLLHELESSDIRVLNLEAPIEGEYKTLDKKSGPRLMQPKSVVSWLHKYGFNLLATSNNHLLDYGKEGYWATRRFLNDFNVIGSGSWNEAYSMHIEYLDGIKVGFLNLCELQFGVLHDNWSQGRDSIGCAWVNHPAVSDIIRNCKNKVDYLIAIIHAGLEMADVPLPEWRDRYRVLIDDGCDAIIGGHTHTVQGYEIYKNKPIFYSLGNFCFSPLSKVVPDGWLEGAAVVLNINKGELTFRYLGLAFKDNQLELSDSSFWNEKVSKLNNMLDDNYMRYVNNICELKLQSYWKLCNMGGLIHKDKFVIKSLLRWILKKYDEVHFLNNLQCESHRWCFSRALRIKNRVV